MERLTPLAAAFLDAEDADRTASLAIGSFAIFEGPVPDFEHFVHLVRGRLPLIPRYRQKLRTLPLDLGAPLWVDDPDFDLRWHIRRTALPAPGGPAEIERLISRVMGQRMDRNRPMWEYWFCEGLPDGQWALLSKLHHCLADGVSGTELYGLVLDTRPDSAPPLVDDWQPEPAGSTLALTAQAVWELARTPAAGLRSASRALRSPVQLVRQVARTTRGLAAITAALRPVQPSSLTGPLHGGRRYGWTSVPMADIDVVRGAFGVTVNDVALAAVTGGFRSLLLSRGEEPTPTCLRSLVPVSTRQPGAEATPDNRVSLLLPYLPVDCDDPVQRLVAVRSRVRALRSAHESEAGEQLTTMAEHGPFPPVSLAVRLGLRLPQHQVSTVTTNVPGPRLTLYGLGRELIEILPYVPIADRVRIGVAIFTYRDRMTFGITADYDTVTDLDVLTTAISGGVAELVAAAASLPV